jgi:hypothetical protein
MGGSIFVASDDCVVTARKCVRADCFHACGNGHVLKPTIAPKNAFAHFNKPVRKMNLQMTV